MRGIDVVLIVEDQYLLQLATIELVESAGFIGIGASNADDAIKILQAGQDIRIVITDVEMPGTMDGVKLAHFIRERWPPVHLIIVSGTALKNESQIPHGTKQWAFIRYRAISDRGLAGQFVFSHAGSSSRR